MAKVRFLPEDVEVAVPAGTTLIAAAVAAHVALDAPCGHRGLCGKCRVQMVSHLLSGEGRGEGSNVTLSPNPLGSHLPIRVGAPDSLEPPTLPERTLLSIEELEAGWRLACQAKVIGDATVVVPERAIKAAIVPLSEIEPRPFVHKIHVSMPMPSIDDAISDLSRLRRALAGVAPNIELDLSVLQTIPSLFTAASYDVTATFAEDRLIGLEPGDTVGKSYGIAVDLGTTSVVVALVNLATGRVLGIESRLNGQANFGADVVSRITYSMSGSDRLLTLQKAAVDTINSTVAALAGKSNITPHQIYEAVIVGNSCMSHLFLGVSPQSLAQAPYQPVISEHFICRAKEIGLDIHPEGSVYTLPNIAGFVGSDTVAVILATSMHRSSEIRLAIDLGTNGEIVLGNKDRLIACSTAAGPAFEGAHISQGMRATDGAIERVWIDGDEIKLQVIGDQPAIGLCGSGLLDAVAQMRRAGLLDESGRLASREMRDDTYRSTLMDRIVAMDGTYGFVLASEGTRQVALSQRDVRELQLAKGAIRAGISILLKEYGIGENDIDEILLAGAFGSFINPASARSIGLVPPLPIQRITAVGNAAGQGAIMALLSTDLRREADEIARVVQYVELSAHSDFMEQFIDDLQLSEGCSNASI